MVENMAENTFKDHPRSKLGMGVVLSQHKGFFGKIKIRPEDFRVTEINFSGKMVQLEGGDETVASSSDGFTTPQLHDEGKKVGTEQESRDSVDDLHGRNSDNTSTLPLTGDQITFDDVTDLDKLMPILEGIIGAEVMEGLRTFSEQELSQKEPSPNASAGPTCSNPRSGPKLQNSVAKGDDSEMSNCFSLGEIAQKGERALVHKAVQCLYPHLKTSVVKLSSFHSVMVSTNPTYWDFRNFTNHQTSKLVRFASSKFSTRTVSINNEDADSKEKRTAIHRLISKHFGKFLETKTYLDENGKQKIVVRFRERYARKDSRGMKRKVVTMEHEGSGPVYTGFTLKKENQETLDALQQLALALRIQPSDFSYAGLKDKKAVTLQSVAVKGVSQKRFKQVLNGANLLGITVGNICPVAKAIHIGYLTGNLFDILIRDVCLHGDDNKDLNQKDTDEGALLWQEIDSCFKSVKERGFVNYFGEQRFGLSCDGESQSAAIGKSILAGKYQEAVCGILAPDGDKDDLVNRAKCHFQLTQIPKEALALMPRYKSRECLILKALHRHGLDRDGCLRALFCIPHAMRQLYIHAFCSLVWNHMASERLRLYGYKVVAGDLVLIGDEKKGTRDKIQEVIEADVQASTFSIRDVVLPLLGNNIRYPSNKLGDAYTKYLEEAGLGSCMYRVTELQMNIPGDYRRLIQWPKDLRWDLEHVCDDNVLMKNHKVKGSVDYNLTPQEYRPCCCDGGERLATVGGSLKDWDNMSETDARYPKHCSDNSQNADNFLQNQTTENCSPGFDKWQVEGKLVVKEANLRVKFSLPPSTYATVLLRELMKR